MDNGDTDTPTILELVVKGQKLRGNSAKAQAFMRHYAAVNRLTLSKEERAFGRNARRRMMACNGPGKETSEGIVSGF